MLLAPTSFCVGATAVWRQERQSITLSNQQLDSLQLSVLADSSFRDDNGCLCHLRKVGADSVQISWVQQDTVFALAGTHGGSYADFKPITTSTPPPKMRKTGKWSAWSLRAASLFGKCLGKTRCGCQYWTPPRCTDVLTAAARSTILPPRPARKPAG